MPLQIATWNVNSVRARQERVLAWLAAHPVDVLCLQELKVTDAAFDGAAFTAIGYQALVHGQPTYNGVGLLVREGLEVAELTRTLDDGVEDPQARLIAARVAGVHVVSVYCPNGGEVGSDKWLYKLRWFDRLRGWLERHGDPAGELALCGDFNVAPHDTDVKTPALWANSTLCHPEARAALAKITAWGLVDLVQQFHPEGGAYTWWDYRQLAFPKNDGLRIDHILATPALAARASVARVDRDARKGQAPSDHAPVLACFDGFS